jgi:hypothetical protein
MVMTSATGPGSVFTLLPGPPDEGGPDILGLWAIASEARVPTPAQSGLRPGVADLPTWHVDLPADPVLATSYLNAAEARLTATDRLLAGVPTALAGIRRPLPGAVAFGAPGSGVGYSGPEARLLRGLDEVWWGISPHSQVSFGGTSFGRIRDEAAAQFRAFVDRVGRTVLTYARVETRVEGRLLAQTVVGWAGDAVTTVAAGLGAAWSAEHGRALAIALATRAAMLRTIGLAARGAVILAMLLSGGGSVLAIPVTWRYIRDVLATVRG